MTPFFETGSEGVHWAVVEVDERGKIQGGYDALYLIQEGDILTIWNHDRTIAFEGKIEYDTKTGYESYPLNPQYGQQVACGMWVHWIQKGWEPDAWGNLFVDCPPRKAQLVTNKKVKI